MSTWMARDDLDGRVAPRSSGPGRRAARALHGETVRERSARTLVNSLAYKLKVL